MVPENQQFVTFFVINSSNSLNQPLISHCFTVSDLLSTLPHHPSRHPPCLSHTMGVLHSREYYVKQAIANGTFPKRIRVKDHSYEFAHTFFCPIFAESQNVSSFFNVDYDTIFGSALITPTLRPICSTQPSNESLKQSGTFAMSDCVTNQSTHPELFDYISNNFPDQSKENVPDSVSFTRISFPYPRPEINNVNARQIASWAKNHTSQSSSNFLNSCTALENLEPISGADFSTPLLPPVNHSDTEVVNMLPIPRFIQVVGLNEYDFGSLLKLPFYQHKPASILCTFLVLDCQRPNSVAIFENFLRLTNLYASKGCIIPLTSVEVHVMLAHADTLDNNVINQTDIIQGCTGVGFDSASIKIHHFEPLSKSNDNDPLVFNQESYRVIYDDLWERLIIPKYVELALKGKLFAPFLGVSGEEISDHCEDKSGHGDNLVDEVVDIPSVYETCPQSDWPCDYLVDALSNAPIGQSEPPPEPLYGAPLEESVPIDGIPIEEVFSTFQNHSTKNQGGILKTLFGFYKESPKKCPARLTKADIKHIISIFIRKGLYRDSVSNYIIHASLMKYFNHMRQIAYKKSSQQTPINDKTASRSEVSPSFNSPLVFFNDPKPLSLDQNVIDEYIPYNQCAPKRYYTPRNIPQKTHTDPVMGPENVIVEESSPILAFRPDIWDPYSITENKNTEPRRTKLPSKVCLDTFMIVQQRGLISDPVGVFLNSSPQWYNNSSGVKSIVHSLCNIEQKVDLPPHVVVGNNMEHLFPVAATYSTSYKGFVNESSRFSDKMKQSMVHDTISQTFASIGKDKSAQNRLIVPSFLKQIFEHNKTTSENISTDPDNVVGSNYDVDSIRFDKNDSNTQTSYIQPINSFQTAVIFLYNYSKRQKDLHNSAPIPTPITIELNYLHRGLELNDELFSRYELSKNSLKKVGFGSSLGFLPHAYSFGTYIIPFYYSHRNSLPVLSYDAAVGYNKIQKDHKNKNDNKKHPYFSNPPIPSCFALPESLAQFPTSSKVNNFNSPTQIVHWFGDMDKPVFDQSRAISSFNQLETQKNLFHTFFQLSCPIHIIVVCLNDVIDDDKIEQHMWDEIQLDDYVGKDKKTTAFRSTGSLPLQQDPITKTQYEYFQNNVPTVYKHEIRSKVFHPFQSFYNFEKFEQDWNFHFVSINDFHHHYKRIQTDAIQKQLDLYEDVLESQ